MKSTYCNHGNVMLCANVAEVITVWPFTIDRDTMMPIGSRDKELAKTSGSWQRSTARY